MHTNPVLHVVFPLADVLIAIWEDHRSLTFFFAGLEVPFVHASIFESELSLTFEKILGKLSLVCSLRLRKVVDARTLEHAIDKITIVVASVSPFVSSAPIFLSLIVFALEFNLAFIPSFTAVSVLEVINPIAVVCGSLRIDECA